MNFCLSARKLAFVFLGATGALTAIHVSLQIVRFWTGDHRLGGLLAMFSLGAEYNFPAYYSALALLVCGLLLLVIALGEVRNRGYKPAYWGVLGGIFLFLSVDEILAIHERLSEPLQSFTAGYRMLHYGWVLPYAGLVLIIVIAYSRFLIGLPRRTAVYFVIAGALFVGGALGLEMMSGYHASVHGTMNVPYVTYQSFEEIMEMLGVVLFLYGLGDYAERRFGFIQLRLTPDLAPSVPEK